MTRLPRPAAHRSWHPTGSRSACRALALPLVALAVAGTASCGSDGDSDNTEAAGSASQASGGSKGTVTVLAAASLTESFGAIKKQVEQDHPGVHVRVSYSASSEIVQQINNGAPADIIALAGQDAMKPLDSGHVVSGGTKLFASNSLEIATPPGNPAKITSVNDLSKGSVKVILCAEQVPCGAAAKTMLGDAAVKAHVVSYERDVKAALAKVQLNEADAAVVYHSDVVSAGKGVHGVKIKPGVNQVLRYPISRLNSKPATKEFTNAVLSSAGQAALHQSGFEAP